MTSTATVFTRNVDYGLATGNYALVFRKIVTEKYEAMDDQGNWVEVGPQELLTDNFKHRTERA